MRIVEVGQYFMTKDTSDFRQFRSVACREYTLPRDDPASQAKGWIQGNMRIGPVLEVTTSFKNFKCGIERFKNTGSVQMWSLWTRRRSGEPSDVRPRAELCIKMDSSHFESQLKKYKRGTIEE